MLRIAEQAHKTDTGRQRHANEDSFFARAPVFAVADGMGGARAGEVASRIAAEAFEPQLSGDRSAEEQLREIVSDANRRIHELAQEDSSRAGMGTTLTAALVGGEDVSLAHVGDSRAYVFRDGALRQLTQDHSLVEELRRQGRLTEDQAASHPQRSVITRALGPEPEIEVDTMTVAARHGDVFLLCSDGLTSMIDEQRIERLASENADLASMVSALVDEANGAGGRDNITVVCFRIEEVESAADREAETLVGETAAKAGLTAAAVTRAAARTEAQTAAPAPEATDDDPGLTLLKPGGAVAPPPHRPATPRRWRAGLVRLLAGLAVLAGLVAAATFGLRQIWFVGSDERGVVALYRGVPYEVPFGLELYQERYATAVSARSLAPDRRRRLLDHTLRSRSDAADIIRRLERRQGILP